MTIFGSSAARDATAVVVGYYGTLAAQAGSIQAALAGAMAEHARVVGDLMSAMRADVGPD